MSTEIEVVVTGPPGPVGPAGPEGPVGPVGPHPTLTVGDVTTGTPDAEFVDDGQDGYELNLTLPPGPELSIGTVDTGAIADAEVTGSPHDGYVLDLTLPPVGANGVNTAAIQDNAVTADKIAANAVGASELADNAVDTAAIAADAVTADKIANDTITAAELAANSVGTSELADDSVTAAKILDGAITANEIQNASITGAKLVNDTITATQIAAGAVDTAAIQDDAVTAPKIAANAVGSSELADNAVDTAAIQAQAVTAAKIADDTITAAQIAANAVGASELADNAVNVAALDADDLGNGLVLTADSGEPSGMKWSAYGIADLDIGTVDTGTPAAASMTGNPQDGYVMDLTLPSAGEDGVGTAAIQDGAVTADKLADQAISPQLREVTSSPVYAGGMPVLTFVNDDCDPLFYDVWKSVADEKGVKISLAVIGASAEGIEPYATIYPSMTTAQLKAIEAEGHDILSHGWDHLATYDDAVTPAMLDADWALARAYMLEHFPRYADVLVYTGGLPLTATAKKAVARKHWRYGITTSASWNLPPVDNWAVQRINGDTSTLNQIKTALDGAKAANGWLVVMTHDKELDSGGRAANMQKLRDVIDYARAQGVAILPWSQAERIKGNAVALGEWREQADSQFISHGGQSRFPVSHGSWTPTLSGSTTPGAHTYNIQWGRWQLHGGLVTVKAAIHIASANLDAAMAGNLRIGGLPFPSSGNDLGAAFHIYHEALNLGTNYTSVWGSMSAADFATLIKQGNNVDRGYVPVSAIPAGKAVAMSFTATYMPAIPAANALWA